MRNKLLVLALFAGLWFGGCQKERFCGEYDLNGDGSPEKVFETSVDKKYSFFYLNNNKDTNYIVRFSKRPMLTGFHDFKKDGFLDFWYHDFSEKEIKTCILDNENGIFSKEERELGQ